MDLHGGNIYKILREEGRKVLDYSANINPLGLPQSLKDKLKEDLSFLEQYPDPEYIEMREAIGKHNDIHKENIIVGNGATEILFLYGKAQNPNHVVIVSPTFAEYERAFYKSKKITYFPLEEKEDFKLSLERLKERIEELNHGEKVDLVVICNPNNPTGGFIPKEEIEELGKLGGEKKFKILVDEAFIEFVHGGLSQSVASYRNKNIFIVRALTKFFAIPGVRLGYGISFDEKLNKKIKEIREPWSVNGIAEGVTKVLLEDREYIKKSEEWIEKEKKWFYQELLKISKVKPYKTQVNFILVKLVGELEVKEFKKLMLEKNILIRDASNFQFLNDKYFRLAIRDRKSNEEVLRSIKDVIR